MEIENEIYIIKHKDGSYSLVIDGEEGNIDGVDEDLLRELPILTE